MIDARKVLENLTETSKLPSEWITVIHLAEEYFDSPDVNEEEYFYEFLKFVKTEKKGKVIYPLYSWEWHVFDPEDFFEPGVAELVANALRKKIQERKEEEEEAASLCW